MLIQIYGLCQGAILIWPQLFKGEQELVKERFKTYQMPNRLCHLAEGVDIVSSNDINPHTPVQRVKPLGVNHPHIQGNVILLESSENNCYNYRDSEFGISKLNTYVCLSYVL